MYTSERLTEDKLKASFEMDSIITQTFDVTDRIFTAVDITNIKLAMIKYGDDYDFHQRVMHEKRNRKLELIHTRYLRTLCYYLERKTQLNQLRQVQRAQLQYVSWWSNQYIPTHLEHLSKLWLFWNCRRSYRELVGGSAIEHAQHLYKCCIQEVHGYQEPRINWAEIRYQWKHKYPFHEIDDKGNSYLSFVNVKDSKTMLTFSILLWFIHRQSADDALFFYTYQNHRSGLLKKLKRYLPKSMMLAHCQHNLRCNLIKLENQYYFDKFDTEDINL
ncbi:hypothetical protein AB4455_04760 [Vibrio sp. 10N.261.46.E12]|uniref:hypothetical protein n=1 Tax=unclassified Vibrio TaxID=2614977 RepID=UPI000975D521|nr:MULTISPECIES: hypothetical protein [unclassified Vibrio]OMO36241.1 hypothetical protein BH584_05545 [Vibrio sp. 10N.261.45.E1]PMJ34407.1 hypothetical protein BCU27_02990 [Vibrio sp. 10N.286.45.B6]PML86778.1 hypothetical protein BCT66_00695 [Vibrio sp. 10N.261.49.E11]PMM76778.1 hypothetical protein BCT48_24570 [Vibrio sp. 10N.261.46.F12]PMM81854.1 hypothetical protein BCT46_15725 [Vibrio sp. 10N.261.46.E8]